MLSELDLKYVPLKVIKGSDMSDFLADSPRDTSPEDYPFPNENPFLTKTDRWSLYFDGASNQKGCSVRVILISLTKEHTPIFVKLGFDVTNNGAEYEACITGLEVGVNLRVNKLRVYRDSFLIIDRITGK